MTGGPRVLYVIDSLSRSGAEQSLVSMAPHLLRLGIDLEVAYLLERPGGLLYELQAVGVVTHAVTAPTSRAGRIAALRRLIRSRDPDLVHTTLFEADIAGRVAARLAGVPSVSSLVNVAYGRAQKQTRGISRAKLYAARWADRFTAGYPVRLHAITHHVAKTMSAVLSIPERKIDVIPRGRDAARLGVSSPERRARVRMGLDVSHDEIVLLAAARHEYQKGLDILITALPSILMAYPKAKLLVAGRQGNETDRLRAMLRDLDIEEHVTLLGMRDDVPDLMVAADAFIAPSRWEGFGGALLEAMALEIPVVAADLAPFHEVTADCAWYFPSNDAQSLANTVQALLRETASARRSRVALGAARFRDQFTVERVSSMMASFYIHSIGEASES